jgi:hypothetical protein
MYQLLADRADAEGNLRISQKISEDVAGWMKIATQVANDFEMKSAHDRIEIILKRLAKGITWDELATECRVLNEAIQSGLKRQLVYRYPDDPGAVLMRWQEDWRPALEKFPTASSDILAGVDCWALGHGTAAVFHFMRVLEFGLATLGNEVGVDVGTKNWQNVINEIESTIRNMGKTLPGGLPKVEKLQFLSEAAKEFTYFKDGWRNYVAHGRSSYDIHQARSAMEHVRAFMNHLASQLSEAP